MASVNKVILVGNLGADPELRYTSSGTPVASFSLATREQWTKKDGEKGEKTEWHKIVAWARLGEICGEYLSKGKQVYIEGRIQTRSWEKDGVTRYTTEIIASEMKMLGARGSSDTYKPAENAGAYTGPRPSVPDKEDDDIPF